MKNKNYSKNKHCICGKLISNHSNKCKSCSRKTYMKSINYLGNNNPNYKQGLPRCVDCNKKLSNYYNKRCCSCEMKRKWQKKLIIHSNGKNHPLYKNIGTIVKSSTGYLVIKNSKNTWMALHRYLVEKYIGYKLDSKWIIHHIDGNRTNNKLRNLYIFTKAGLHRYVETLIRYNVIKRNDIKSNLNNFKR